MHIASQHRGASFLVEETDPREVVTPEDMGDEERMMMRAIQDFAHQEVVAVLEEIENKNFDVIGPLFRKAADLGIFMAEVPEEYGGLGLSVLAVAGMNESRAYLGGLGSTVFAHQGIGTLPLINFGTKEQIDKYLRPCMEGKLMAAFALTEPSSGSDAMNIRTTAVLNAEGTHYIVNGSKQWITNAGWADLFILFAKVDGTKFSAFLLERNTPGLTVGAHEKLLGLHGSSVCALALDNVQIPVANLLGEVGKGHKVAMCTLNLGRLKMSASCAGTSKKMLAVAAQYAAERLQFGQPIAAFGLIQRKLADMAARAYAAESVAYRTAGLVYAAVEAMGDEAKQSLDAKLKALTEFSVECAMAKVFASETYNNLADEALQIYGGYGFSEDYPVAQPYRDSRITRIYEGTSEICRLSISKTILKRSAAAELDLPGAITALQLSGKPDSERGVDRDLAALKEQIGDLKKIYLYLLGQVSNRLGPEQMLDNDHQQFLGSLADIAIETYVAESTVLRVLKLKMNHPRSDTTLPEALALVHFERATDRIRQESTEILSALYSGDELRDQLRTIGSWLPLPHGQIATRAFIARSIVEAKGALPEYAG